MKYRWIAVAMMIIMAVTITACSRREATKIVYDLEEEPLTVDPQCASDQSAYTAINSLFEGLLTVGKDGKLKNGLAKDYSVSEDGLTYSFTLKDHLKWSDGTPLTANDFVFAFERLFDPSTGSVAVSSFYCIENGQEINQGKLDPSQVGVEAVSDTQLVFHLEYPNALFLQLLTTAPAMPCNEAFFTSCKGEYGLEADKLITCGPYELTRWLHDDSGYLKLEKNENYYATDEIDLDSISLWTCYDAEERLERFEEGTTNVYLSEKDMSEEYKEENITKIENTVWGLSFNFQKAEMQNQNFRLAIASCFDRSRYIDLLSNNLTCADRLVPPNVLLDGESYQEITSDVSGITYDENAAREYYSAALNELGVSKLNLTVIMEENDQIDHEKYFSYISQLIQKLDLFCTIEVLPSDEYEEKLSSGEYDMAIIDVKAEYNHPLSILDAFSSDNTQNVVGYQDQEYDQMTQQVLLSPNHSSVLENAKKAEEKLLHEAVFIPLYDQSDYLITASDVSTVFLNQENGLLTFQYAIIK